MTFPLLCCRCAIVFCRVCADRSGMAAVAACVILLSFAAESRKSYGSGSLKVANGPLAVDFSRFWS